MINSNPNMAKNNQMIVKGIIFIGMFVIILFFFFLTDDPKEAEELKKSKTNIEVKSLVNEEELVKTRFMGDVATNLDMANTNMRDVKKENELLKNELQDIKQMLASMKKESAQTSMTNANGKVEPSFLTSAGLFKAFPQPPVAGQAPNQNGQPLNSDFMKPQKNTVVKTDKINDSLNVFEIKKKGSDDDSKSAKTEERPDEYLPTGSITKVTLLSGFDAPTMAQAKTNPLPILMKMSDMSILPNRYKYDLRECFVVGEGYGDLSSERVYIRTNTLSCMTKTGKHIDMDFKAMVAGEDGKIGLRGTVVTKQGSLLARSLIAGFLEGVGGAFKQSQEYALTGATGVTTGVQQMTTEKALQYGAFGGASKAAEKLADFYLKLADQTSPVIEISANREVELVTTGLTKFITLEEQKNDEK